MLESVFFFLREIYNDMIAHKLEESFLIRYRINTRYFKVISIKQIFLGSTFTYLNKIELLEIINNRNVINESSTSTYLFMSIAHKSSHYFYKLGEHW